MQLPVILHTPDAHWAQFLPWEVNKPRMQLAHQYFIGWVTVGEMKEGPLDKIPLQYHKLSKVFSKEASYEFPPTQVWDHSIELKPNAPTTLPGKIYPLSQVKLQELQKIVQEHLKQGTIYPSKSPYAASFFFIKKKDGKLRPV